MKSFLTLGLALVCAAATAVAQGTKAPDTKAKAPETKVVDTKAKAADTKAADSKQAAPTGTKAADTKAAPPAAPALNAAQQAQLRTPVIMREVYAYSVEGRRDPFLSLLSSSDLRPTVGDLRLTGVLYDENGSNSIAVMRDLVTNAQYRVVTGQTLGRMKVALIKRKVVIFSIEEFGMNRQDSLVLGDTTKVRAR
jgi:hypothetical protein